VAAGLGSAALLAAAFAFEYIGGLEPCALCIAQRWPHLGAALAAAWLWARRGHADATAAFALGAVMATGAFAAAAFHVGVELGAWASPFGCGLPDWSDPNLDQTLATQTPVDCTQPAWTFLGHSMAAWNALLSVVLAGTWVGSWMAHTLQEQPAHTGQ
jgi:disulfide bond formation protein DsbB